MTRLLLLSGAIGGMFAVGFGAFGAHLLKGRLSPELLAAFQTGVQYQFYHSLGLLLIGILAMQLPDSLWLKFAGCAMLSGIVLFSGSLYLHALTGTRWLGAITPIGGVAFISAWLLLAIAVSREL
jgi:uncharacterized membrane protein YgdD (TMEM256/DUF423 family)